MAYHENSQVADALVYIMDALSDWESNTGGKSTLVFIPHDDKNSIVMLQDGTPLLPEDTKVTPEEIIVLAMQERNKN